MAKEGESWSAKEREAHKNLHSTQFEANTHLPTAMRAVGPPSHLRKGFEISPKSGRLRMKGDLED